MIFSSRRQPMFKQWTFHYAVFTSLFVFFCFLFSGGLSAAQVPDTEKPLCYDGAGKAVPCRSPCDRGHGFKNMAKPQSFTKLDGNGNDLPDSASSWEMVRDNVTGLIWEVKTNMDGSPNYGDSRDADNTYTWYDSNPATNGGDAGKKENITDTEDFLSGLNAIRFGGYSDWRLPTKKELQSIVSYKWCKPAINPVYFPNTVESHYWTSTTFVEDTWGALNIDFSQGSSDGSYKYEAHHARAVRGGK